MLRKTLFTDKEELAPTRDGFGKALLDIGKDERVVALCADLTESVKMQAFKDAYPKRFLEMGICEQSMASVASGIASMGRIPFMASYAMFSPGRNWEQIRTTICYNDMPVKVVGAHAGISVGPDGATHQALEDIALMRAIPNMSIIVPCDSVEMYKATVAISKIEKPFYLRMTREKTPIMTEENTSFAIGKAYTMYLPKKEYAHEVGIIGCGPILYEALKAARELEAENIGVTVVNMHTVKPLDTDFLYRFAMHKKRIVIVEEHQKAGGLGSAIAEALAEHSPVPLEFIAVEDRFGQSGTPSELYKEYGLTSEHIKEKVRKVLGRH